MWFTILNWVKARVILLGAAVVGVVAAVSALRRSGRRAAENDFLEEVLDNVRTKDAVSQKIDRLPDGDAARRLRDKWSRD